MHSENSNQLDEAQVVKNFLGSLFGKSTKVTAQISTMSGSSEEKQAREIVTKIVAAFDAKIGRVERKKNADTIILRYHVSIGSKKFVLKAYIMLESKFFNLSLWDSSQDKLLDVLAVGDLKSKYRLRAMGKIRFKPWTKD